MFICLTMRSPSKSLVCINIEVALGSFYWKASVTKGVQRNGFNTVNT